MNVKHVTVVAGVVERLDSSTEVINLYKSGKNYLIIRTVFLYLSLFESIYCVKMSGQFWQDGYEYEHANKVNRNVSYRTKHDSKKQFNEYPKKASFQPQYLNGDSQPNKSNVNRRKNRNRYYQNPRNRNRNKNQRSNQQKQYFKQTTQQPLVTQDVRQLNNTQEYTQVNKETVNYTEYNANTVQFEHAHKNSTEFEHAQNEMYDQYLIAENTYENGAYDQYSEENTRPTANFLQFNNTIDKKDILEMNEVSVDDRKTYETDEDTNDVKRKSDTNAGKGWDLIVDTTKDNAKLYTQIKCVECILEHISNDIKYKAMEKELNRYHSELKFSAMKHLWPHSKQMKDVSLVKSGGIVVDKQSSSLKPTKPPMLSKKNGKKPFPVKPPFLHSNQNSKPLVSLSVKIPHNQKTEVIHVWNGDDIKQMSIEFCGKHQMMHNQEIVYIKLKQLLDSIREKQKQH